MPKTKSVETPEKVVNHTAKITDAKIMDILSDNTKVIDVSFDLLLDGEVVAERRLSFPLGTTEEAITAEVKAYCQMFENDHASAAEAQKRSEAEAEAEGMLTALKGKEV